MGYIIAFLSKLASSSLEESSDTEYISENFKHYLVTDCYKFHFQPLNTLFSSWSTYIDVSFCFLPQFQKKLQMRIEEHANYLEKMFDQQKRSRSFFESHNSTKGVDLFIAECSSNGKYENNKEVILTKPEP